MLAKEQTREKERKHVEPSCEPTGKLRPIHPTRPIEILCPERAQASDARVLTEVPGDGNPEIAPKPAELDGFDSLARLALDIRWSWNHATDGVWRQLDPELWELTHNPWIVLQTVSRKRIKDAFADPDFKKNVDALLRTMLSSTNARSWFQENHSHSPLTCVAYFSMEFMLSEALPIYSGGLGNVAGDQLKAASDLGVPVVGVGLLYQRGYFRQVIDRDGAQQALYPYNDPGQLPITPLRTADGEWLRLEIALPGYSVWLRAWQVQVGRVKLYLLDSNDAANFPAHRGITSELYGGGPEMRLKQELVLGIGGWRLLAALGHTPEVCHLNEGHAAFAVLERARDFMQESSQPFPVALAATRAGNIFTTHTAVEAGFDRFSPALVEQYLGGYATQKLGIPLKDLLALGRQDPEDDSENFNMAYLAVRGSGAVNGVSRLHGEVSRRLFQPLFPRWPTPEVPIAHVTNGVDMSSWDSAAADDLWTETCGKDRWLGDTSNMEAEIRGLSDARLWQFHTAASKSLAEYVRQRLSRQLASSGATREEVEGAKHMFDPTKLTLGFARRFATYKRPNLLLHDPDRLIRILSDAQRPVQILLAGKAHPADQAGQALIHEWTNFVQRPEVQGRAIFFSDYDMLLTEHLVQGVDVWINTPRRPWEACGTSGMKVLVNGGINLSELDGWWAEAYAPEVGWALGDGLEHGDDPGLDAVEAQALYEMLESQVIPEFYARDERGIPVAWVGRMRESMARLTPRFSAERAVREYTERFYLPAATSVRIRVENEGSIGAKIDGWRRDAERKWADLRFGEMKVETRDGLHLFEVQVWLDELDPVAVMVQLYADGIDGGVAVHHEMGSVRPLAGATGSYAYSGAVSAARPAEEYTARMVPRFDGVAVPLEAKQILWQR
jgi:starch phosphorylase